MIFVILMNFGIYHDFSLGAKIPTGAHEEDKDAKAVYTIIMFDFN